MAASGGGGGGGLGCFWKIGWTIIIVCLAYLGIMYGVVQNRNGAGFKPDTPDRSPCVQRCDRAGNEHGNGDGP